MSKIQKKQTLTFFVLFRQNCNNKARIGYCHRSGLILIIFSWIMTTFSLSSRSCNTKCSRSGWTLRHGTGTVSGSGCCGRSVVSGRWGATSRTSGRCSSRSRPSRAVIRPTLAVRLRQRYPHLQSLLGSGSHATERRPTVTTAAPDAHGVDTNSYHAQRSPCEAARVSAAPKLGVCDARAPGTECGVSTSVSSFHRSQHGGSGPRSASRAAHGAAVWSGRWTTSH